MLEYESVLSRQLEETGLRGTDVEDVLDYLALVGQPCTVYFRWRPYLPDPKDDMILELAVAGECSHIVTFNLRHFSNLHRFGVVAVTPAQFLDEIGELR